MVYWNIAYFKQLYEQYTTSGTNARTFCQLQGINENRFYYWVHKLKLVFLLSFMDLFDTFYDILL